MLEPSPDRMQDPCGGCRVFRKCGGCAFRHITYESELRLKDKAVRDAFTRLGGFSQAPLPILGSEKTDRYRNKAQYPLAVMPDGIIEAGSVFMHETVIGSFRQKIARCSRLFSAEF